MVNTASSIFVSTGSFLAAFKLLTPEIPWPVAIGASIFITMGIVGAVRATK